MALVFVFHGTREVPQKPFFDLSGISALAEERQFIVIPQAGIYNKKEGLD